jgi:hypothetical protein
MSKDTEIVAAALQRGYGDATQTVLDHRVAREVIKALREVGWCSPDEVALIVEAAGGSVTVSDDVVWQAFRNPDENPMTLVRERLPHAFSTRLSVRR